MNVDGDGPAWYPSFSSDGSLVATYWIGDETVRGQRHDLRSARRRLRRPRGVGAVELSPDGRQLVYATQDGVGLVDVDSGETVRRLDPIDALAFEVAWSPDGDSIATGNDDGTVRVWDPATGVEVAVGDGDLTEVVGLDWSADGARVAVRR